MRQAGRAAALDGRRCRRHIHESNSAKQLSAHRSRRPAAGRSGGTLPAQRQVGGTMSISVHERILAAEPDAFDPPFAIARPARQAGPFVIASPHSGRNYPDAFLAASRLDPVTLRRSEDSFVDEIFAGAPGAGFPLLSALFPRAYVDPNREPFELDPSMFADPLPAYVNARSTRVAGGLGTVARVVTDGEEIYADRLTFADAIARIDALYRPYHAALQDLLAETAGTFGCAVLIDCHSMPSIGGPMDEDRGRNRADIVLGDRYGTSCAPALTLHVSAILRDLGYAVVRNNPYAGGHTTEHYGRPADGIHALQIEINRALYMDERRVSRGPGLPDLAADMTRMMESLAGLERKLLRPPAAAQ
jgi:N-formylglutamate amidohydrolase